MLNPAQITTVKAEIEALRTAGISDILVSVDNNHEARWGEVTALSAEEMEREMASIDCDPTGMLTAEEFEARY